jgi:predicted signal transduction protein with EAL and GGDEF domain
MSFRCALLREACRDAKTRTQSRPIFVQSVAGTTKVQHTRTGIDVALVESEFPAQRFENKITENTLVNDIDAVRTELDAFHQAGVRITRLVGAITLEQNDE